MYNCSIDQINNIYTYIDEINNDTSTIRIYYSFG